MPLAAPCPTCRGTGAKPGTTPKVCPACQGRGVETEGQGMFSISQPCSRLRRQRHRDQGARARPAAAAAQTPQVKRYRVNIPAGVRDGSRMRLAGKGEAGRRGGPPGDLYVVTRVADGPVFKRKGDNLEVEVPITIVEAVKGATVEVPTLAGSKRIRVPAGTAARHRPAPARRGPAEARRQGPRRHPLPLHDRGAAHALEGAERGVDELDEVMNGDPRERLFTREEELMADARQQPPACS